MSLLVGALLAAPLTPVQFDVPSCLAASAGELKRRLALELRTSASVSLGPPPPGARVTSVRLACEGSTLTAVATSPDRTPVPVRFELEALSRADGLREVALALAEAVLASWTSPPPAPTAAPPAEPPPTPPPAPGSPRRWELQASGLARLASVPLFGGAVGVAMWPWPLVGLALEVSVARGSAARLGTRVDARADEVALAALLGGPVGPLWLRLGLGARGAWLGLQGVALGQLAGGSVESLATSPWALAGLDVRPVGPLLVSLAVEGGVWPSSLRGQVDGAEDVVLGGPWGQVRLGVGLAW